MIGVNRRNYSINLFIKETFIIIALKYFIVFVLDKVTLNLEINKALFYVLCVSFDNRYNRLNSITKFPNGCGYRCVSSNEENTVNARFKQFDS